jgi:hypothetical protein
MRDFFSIVSLGMQLRRVMRMDAKSDAKSDDRQFWLRFLLVVGMLVGAMTLVTLPVVLGGWSGSALGFFATVFSAVTVLPACAMAFWFRRIACFWLTLNGVLVVVAEVTPGQQVRGLDLGSIASFIVPVTIALCLDYTEIRRWPGALGR